jgi:hypothetical protein
MYKPEDGQQDPKHVVLLIWSNKQIDSLVQSMQSLVT